MEFKLGPPPFSGRCLLKHAHRPGLECRVEMSRARMIPMVVPAFAILGLAAGCGGGKDQVSAAELVQKADQICRQEQTKFTQIQTHPPVNAPGCGQPDQGAGPDRRERRFSARGAGAPRRSAHSVRDLSQRPRPRHRPDEARPGRGREPGLEGLRGGPGGRRAHRPSAKEARGGGRLAGLPAPTHGRPEQRP